MWASDPSQAKQTLSEIGILDRVAKENSGKKVLVGTVGYSSPAITSQVQERPDEAKAEFANLWAVDVVEQTDLRSV